MVSPLAEHVDGGVVYLVKLGREIGPATEGGYEFLPGQRFIEGSGKLRD